MLMADVIDIDCREVTILFPHSRNTEESIFKRIDLILLCAVVKIIKKN